MILIQSSLHQREPNWERDNTNKMNSDTLSENSRFLKCTGLEIDREIRNSPKFVLFLPFTPKHQKIYSCFLSESCNYYKKKSYF